MGARRGRCHEGAKGGHQWQSSQTLALSVQEFRGFCIRPVSCGGTIAPWDNDCVRLSINLHGHSHAIRTIVSRITTSVAVTRARKLNPSINRRTADLVPDHHADLSLPLLPPLTCWLDQITPIGVMWCHDRSRALKAEQLCGPLHE
jgi:hypothetical protein